MSAFRANPGGWLLAAFFLGLGIFFAAAPPADEPEARPTGFVFIGVGLFLLGLYVFLIIKGRRAQELAQSGLHGKAIVKEWTDTGTTVNDHPLVKLVLELHVDGLPVYEVKKRLVVPRTSVGALSAGVLSVHVDPADREEFEIDWGAR